MTTPSTLNLPATKVKGFGIPAIRRPVVLVAVHSTGVGTVGRVLGPPELLHPASAAE